MDDLQAAARAFLRSALEKTGWSPYRLAKEARISATTITRPLNNDAYKFVPKMDTLAKIAAATQTELPDILKSTVSMDTFEIRHSIPLVGEVRAGSWETIPDEPSISEWLPMEVPEYAGAALFGLRVVGRSMDLVFPDGTIVIICPTAESGIREGDNVVVRRYDVAGRAETTLKEVFRGRDGVIVLQPRSTDPAHQIPLLLPVNRDEAVDEGYQIIGVVVATYAVQKRGKGPLLSV